MRTATLYPLVIVGVAACAAAPTFGPLGEGSSGSPSIAAIDSSRPPKSLSVKIDRDAYVVVLLVIPGHSASLLYPRDSVTDNRFAAGVHNVTFEIPAPLARLDAVEGRGNRDRGDSTMRPTSRSRTAGAPLPLVLATTTKYLLVVTSPQHLGYRRILEKTAGVSIPLVDSEALNAVGKAVKSTLTREPREWAGYYQLVPLTNKD